jgi:hypothetical protein
MNVGSNVAITVRVIVAVRTRGRDELDVGGDGVKVRHAGSGLKMIETGFR